MQIFTYALAYAYTVTLRDPAEYCYLMILYMATAG